MEKAIKQEKQNGCLQVLEDTRLVKVRKKKKKLLYFAFFPKGLWWLAKLFLLKNKNSGKAIQNMFDKSKELVSSYYKPGR